jgi:ABC-type multidrug transport system fused ATPase/permease subunit
MKYFYQLKKILNKNQKKNIVLLTIYMFVLMLLEILMLNTLLILLKYFSNPASVSESKAVIFLKNFQLDYDLYLVLITVFLIIFLAKTFANIVISWKENKFIFQTRAELSLSYFKGYLYLPRIFHLRTNTSATVRNITTEVESLGAAIHAIIIITMESVILLGISFYLFFVSFKITLISFSLLLFFSLILNFFNAKKIFSMGKERVKLVQLRFQYIIEGLSGSKVYEMTGSQKSLISNFIEPNSKIGKISSSTGFRQNLPKPLFELFVLLIIALFLAFTLDNNSQIKNVAPTLGVFLTAVYRLIPSFARIISNIQRFQYHIQSAERLSIDAIKFEENKKVDNEVKLNFKELIILKNVSFSYNKNLKNGENFILKDINLTIRKGKKIGIIGVSGTGKSTFLDLCMGLISPQEGKILIDENSIESVKTQWQKNIGCVPQDVFIIDDTLKKNIAFGLPNESIDDNRVKRVIELANLSELQNTLKLGIEDKIGEAGKRISGGQRQRIGIARALYRDPEILIFDEATNALDIETEKNIIREIFVNTKDKTIIFVSHNQENLKYCDSIYKIHQGVLKRI